MDTIKTPSAIQWFNTANFRTVWLTVLSIIIVLCIGLFIGLAIMQVTGVDQKLSSGAATIFQSTQEVPELDFSKLNEKKIVEQQLVALDAIILQTDEKAVSSEIVSRPDFVSPIEWLILKGVAKSQQHGDITLARLVNHLRFAKQEEAWGELLNSADMHKRHALANKLLSGIPLMVADNNLSLSRAQRLQVSLLEDLVSDSEERMRRLAEEAKHIGVTFELKNSPSS